MPGMRNTPNRKQAIAIARNEKAKAPNAINAPPRPSRPSGAARTPALKHPGEGYDLPKMHTSKLR